MTASTRPTSARWHASDPTAAARGRKGNMKRVNKITQQARKRRAQAPDLDISRRAPRGNGEFPTQTKAKRGDFNYSVNGVILRRFAAVAIANHLIYYSNVTVHAPAKVVAADEYKALNHADPHIYVSSGEEEDGVLPPPLSRPEERVEAIGYLQDAAANALKRRKTGTQLVNVKIPVAGPAMLVCGSYDSFEVLFPIL
eukprot:tig00021464_g21747.t1